ncbi:hypothetical protein [Mobilitalea sibirica]|uniref:hypothetical protein n=1 Tax=Mobilitalea sibirica TaxID=1462919 RepID=UPI0018D38905|nr:hypothetical protein [Mobilitalea sibirica]
MKDNGLLFLSFHVGDEVLHVNSLFDEEVMLDYIFFNTDEIVRLLDKHKFRIIEALTRYPYDGYEYGGKKDILYVKGLMRNCLSIFSRITLR